MAQPTLLDFLPLFTETQASIRARLDADVNAGLEPGDPRWVDTREGTFYYVVSQILVLEFGRIWDAMAVELPAVAFPQYSFGQYLDNHAAVFGLERNPATKAEGVVLITGDPAAAVVAGIVVSAPPEDPEEDDIEFITTQAGVTSAQLDPPTGLIATPNPAGGAMATGTYTYSVTAYNTYGETIGGTEMPAVVVGPAGSVALDWDDVAGATGYRVYRRTGAAGFRIAEVAVSTFTDLGAVIAGVGGPPDANTTAGVRVTIQAVEDGTRSNVAAGSIEEFAAAVTGLDNVSNEAATTGGTDEEADEDLKERILLQYGGQGPGTVNDYKRWALDEAGVARVTVVPNWNGAGTVQVVVMDEDGDPVSAGVLASLQARLDPDAGQGAGQAPIGAIVTVQTPVVDLIDVGATVQFEAGYNLDGAGGLIGVRSQIEQALQDYLDKLDVGEDVVYEHVKAQFFRVPGVYNISGVTVEGATSDVAIQGSPPHVAQFGTATLA